MRELSNSSGLCRRFTKQGRCGELYTGVRYNALKEAELAGVICCVFLAGTSASCI